MYGLTLNMDAAMSWVLEVCLSVGMVGVAGLAFGTVIFFWIPYLLRDRTKDIELAKRVTQYIRDRHHR